jgi:pimeloyl-ACP methyl ester carboxylesterase
MNVEMHKHRLKSGNIFMDVFYKKGHVPETAVVLGYGLLSSPERKDAPLVQRLVQEGFMVWVPHFEGTFASDGKCTFDNAVGTFLVTIKAIKEGKGIELWGNKEVEWKISQIILAGASFGGSAALVAGAKTEGVRKIVGLAAVSSYKKRAEEADMMEYYKIWKRGWQNVWRIGSTDDWKRFAKGNVDLNPIEYVEKLKDKHTLLIHTKDDKIVDLNHSINMQTQFERGRGVHKLVVINSGGHFGISDLAQDSIFEEFIKWLKEVEGK